MDMIKCASQINTVFNSWGSYIVNSGSHILITVNSLSTSDEHRPQHRDHYLALSDKCVGSFKSLDRVSRDWTYGLTSLSEKKRKSNRLQMLEQRQHLLLNYFKTLSVCLAGNRTPASRTIDRLAPYQLYYPDGGYGCYKQSSWFHEEV